MPAYRVRALVLHKTKLGETDTILTLLAEDGSQVRAVAKGMRKPGSRLGGRLEPYAVADLLVHTGRSLDVISEADTATSHATLREDYDRSTAAAVVANVLEKTSQEGQAEPRIFGLALATLGAMERAPVERLLGIVCGFLVKALAMHGYRPELDSCACCAEEATGGHLFSLQSGGVLCPGCGRLDGAALRFTQEGRELIAYLLSATMARLADEDLPADTLRETFVLLRSFVSYHVPARLRALDFYAAEAGL